MDFIVAKIDGETAQDILVETLIMNYKVFRWAMDNCEHERDKILNESFKEVLRYHMTPEQFNDWYENEYKK